MMSKEDFRLVRPVKDAYSTREVGYEDTFDYPNLYDEKTGEVGICGGHGIYAWAQREDYELLNQTKPKMKVNKKLFEKSKRGPFNKSMIFKTIKEGFEYFSKFNKPKER